MEEPDCFLPKYRIGKHLITVFSVFEDTELASNRRYLSLAAADARVYSSPAAADACVCVYI